MIRHNIRLSDKRDHIVLTVVGEFRGQDMMECIIEAHALGKDVGVNRYLVDVTEARNIDSVIANYDFAYSDIRKTAGVDVRAQVAVLASPGDSSHDFVETALRNAGLPIKLFTDRDIALDHLFRESTPDRPL